MRITKKYIKNLIREQIEKQILEPITKSEDLNTDEFLYWILVCFVGNGGYVFSKKNGNQMRQMESSIGTHIKKFYAYPANKDGIEAMLKKKDELYPPPPEGYEDDEDYEE